MNLYVVRHGQTDWNKNKILLGNTDIELNDIGKKQALQLKDKLANIKFDYVISSNLKRAYETANIISNNKIIQNTQLRERSYGKLEGTSPKNISEYWNVQKNLKDNSVEPIKSFLNRIFAQLDNILKNYNTCENVLIVTHYGVVMAIDAYFNDKYNYCFDNFIIENCEYKKYNIEI